VTGKVVAQHDVVAGMEEPAEGVVLEGVRLPPWIIKSARWLLTALGIVGGGIFAFGAATGHSEAKVEVFEKHVAEDESRWPKLEAFHHDVDKRVALVEEVVGGVKDQMGRVERKVDGMLIRFAMGDIIKKEGRAPEPNPREAP